MAGGEISPAGTCQWQVIPVSIAAMLSLSHTRKIPRVPCLEEQCLGSLSCHTSMYRHAYFIKSLTNQLPADDGKVPEQEIRQQIQFN